MLLILGANASHQGTTVNRNSEKLLNHFVDSQDLPKELSIDMFNPKVSVGTCFKQRKNGLQSTPPLNPRLEGSILLTDPKEPRPLGLVDEKVRLQQRRRSINMSDSLKDLNTLAAACQVIEEFGMHLDEENGSEGDEDGFFIKTTNGSIYRRR